MDNASKIDSILEELKQKVPATELTELVEADFSDEQIALKSLLKNRRIRYLIHFTDAKNIPSIRENGVLSVEQLEKRRIIYKQNDEYRKDNEPDYISLSVSGMNQYVYRTFRYSNQSIEHGVAVVINAEILYKELNTNRIYCNTNAATADANKGSTIEDFEAMFSDMVEYTTLSSGERKIDRLKEKRNSYETTDIQAEILWNKRVPPEYIMFYWDLEEDFFYGN